MTTAQQRNTGALIDAGWRLVAEHTAKDCQLYAKPDGGYVRVTNHPDGSRTAVAVSRFEVCSMQGWVSWRFVDMDWRPIA